MNINTRELDFVNFTDKDGNEYKDLDFVNFNGVTVYEAWKELTKSEVPPITLQKCKGANLVDYKIYGNTIQDGTPTPETPIEVENVGEYDEETGKYKIPVKVTGKNIADPKQIQRFVDGMQDLGGNGAYTKFYTDENGRKLLGMYCASGYGTPNYSEIRKIFTGIFKENTQYTLSFDFYNSYSHSPDTAVNLSVRYTDGSYATNAEIFAQFPSEARVVYHYTFTSNANKTIETIQLNYNNGSTYIYLDTLQIEEGTTATEYEEYKETVTNIYLNEPLRKIGSRADYIDFKKQKVYRNIKELIANGSENWIITSIYLSNCFNLNLTDMVNSYQGTGVLIYSTHFPGSTKWLEFNQRLNIITAYRQHLGIGFTDGSGNNSIIGTTVDEFKTWLKTQYDSGTPLKMYYPLVKENDTETIELPNISTYKGTNIIGVDTTIEPSNMEVTYIGKK